jgi:hypothetical protein
MQTIHALLVCVATGCALPEAEPVAEAIGDVAAPAPQDPVCSLKHPFTPAGYYAPTSSPGFKAWGSPDCDGAMVASERATDCVQFHALEPLSAEPPLDPERRFGAVYCADMSKVVPAAFYEDHTGACVQAAPTLWPFREWHYCGILPLPPELQE